MGKGVITHSSGGRRLLCKNRGGQYWLHVEDGFSVVDMPIPDRLAEELAEFLGSSSATVTPAPVPEEPDDDEEPEESPTEEPEKGCNTCDGSGEVIGLLAGFRERCPECG
jgi:hypothetical protein